MLQIQFEYNHQINKIQSKLEDKFQIVIDKYLQKSQLNYNNIIFLVKGRKINPEEKVENYMNEIDKQNKYLKVLVQLIEDEENQNKEVIIKSKEIICPKCYEPCRIKIDNYKLELYGCKNNHIIKDILIFSRITKNKYNKYNMSKM